MAQGVGVNEKIYNLYMDARTAVLSGGDGEDKVFLRDNEGSNTTRAWTAWPKRDKDFVADSKRMRQFFYDAVKEELSPLGVSMTTIPKSILERFKLGDFDVKNGVVRSGCPLTARRIVLITQAVAEYKKELAAIAHAAVADGIAELKRPGSDEPLVFTPAQIKTMERMVMRDLSRRDSEKRPRPTAAQIAGTFADGTHPALRYVTTVCQMYELKAEAEGPAKRWNDSDSLAVYANGAKNTAEARDRQDLLAFVCPGGEKADKNFGMIVYGFLCEHRNEMRAEQPNGTIRFDTMWKACFGEKPPSALAKADDFTRSEALFAAATKKLVGIMRNSGQGGIDANLGDEYLMSQLAIGADAGFKPERYAHFKGAVMSGQADIPILTADDVIGKLAGYPPVSAGKMSYESIFDACGKDWERMHPMIDVAGEKFDANAYKHDNQPFDRDFLHKVADKVGALTLGNELQKKTVLMLLHQAAFVGITGALDAPGRKLTDMNISVTRLENGSVQVKYEMKPGMPLDLAFTYTVHTDGVSFATVERINPRDPDALAAIKARMADSTATMGNVFDETIKAIFDESGCSDDERALMNLWMADKMGGAALKERLVGAFAKDYAAAGDDATVRATLKRTLTEAVKGRFPDGPAAYVKTWCTECLVNAFASHCSSSDTAKRLSARIEAFGDKRLVELYGATIARGLKSDSVPELKTLQRTTEIDVALEKLVADPAWKGRLLSEEDRVLIKELVLENARLDEAEGKPVNLKNLFARVAALDDLGLAVALAGLNRDSYVLSDGIGNSVTGKCSQELALMHGVRDAAELKGRLQMLRLHVGTNTSKPMHPPIGSLMLLVETLPTLRKKYPDTDIFTREQIVDVLREESGVEPPAEDLTEERFRDYVHKVVDAKVNTYLKDYRKNLPKREQDGSVSMVGTSIFGNFSAIGVSFTAALKAGFKVPGFTISAKDFTASPALYAPEDAKRQRETGMLLRSYAADFVRQRLEVTLGTGDDAQTFDLRDVKAIYGNDTARAKEMLDKFDTFLQGVPEAQRDVAFTGLMQAGFGLFRAIGLSEHASCRIDVTKNGAGDVVLHYRTHPWCPVDASYSYTVHQDGSSELSDVEVKNRDVKEMAALNKAHEAAQTRFIERAKGMFQDRLEQALRQIADEAEREEYKKYVENKYEDYNVEAMVTSLVAGDFAVAGSEEERKAIIEQFDQYTTRALDKIVTAPVETLNGMRVDFVKEILTVSDGNNISNRKEIMAKVRALSSWKLADLVKNLRATDVTGRMAFIIDYFKDDGRVK